jgi:hypothetical protein
MSTQVDPAHPGWLVAVRKRPFHELPSPTHQPLAPSTTNPPAIRIHRRLFFALVLPTPPAPTGLRDITANLPSLQRPMMSGRVIPHRRSVAHYITWQPRQTQGRHYLFGGPGPRTGHWDGNSEAVMATPVLVERPEHQSIGFCILRDEANDLGCEPSPNDDAVMDRILENVNPTPWEAALKRIALLGLL